MVFTEDEDAGEVHVERSVELSREKNGYFEIILFVVMVWVFRCTMMIC